LNCKLARTPDRTVKLGRTPDRTVKLARTPDRTVKLARTADRTVLINLIWELNMSGRNLHCNRTKTRYKFGCLTKSRLW